MFNSKKQHNIAMMMSLAAVMGADLPTRNREPIPNEVLIEIKKRKKFQRTIDKLVRKVQRGTRIWEFNLDTKNIVERYDSKNIKNVLQKIYDNNLQDEENNSIFVIALNRKNAFRKFKNIIDE
jgi:hypothetical protein